MFIQMLNVDCDWQARIIVKILLKHENITLNSMTQTRKNVSPWWWIELTFEYGHAMVFCFYGIPCFFLLFRTNGKKKNDKRAISVAAVKIIILKMSFWKLLDISHVQSSFSRLRGTLTTAFKRHLTVENFTNVDQHTCQFFLG